jgi:3-deoxy-D-manno-octulosonic-acid transferase
MSAARLAYAGAATLAAPGLRLMLRARVRRGKEIAARLPERRGLDPSPRPAGRVLWLHAASVGETMSILPVLAALHAAAPRATLLVSTGTRTSADLLAARAPEFGGAVIHRFVPLDVPAWVARFLDHWRPDAAGFVESELWPNLLAACAARRIPTMLVNARLSARSAARWRRMPGLARDLLGGFARIDAQSEADAARLREAGAHHVAAPGNLKFAAPPLPADPAELTRLRRLIEGRPVWLAASTHRGEEAIAAEVHRRLAQAHPGLLTIIAPRHPDRGPQIAADLAAPDLAAPDLAAPDLAAPGLAAPRRAAGEAPGALWIADTLGELGLLYRLAPIVLVGRSLLPPGGGQNPLEPGRLGCAVAVGPHAHNFAEPLAVLEAAGGVARVADAAALAAFVDTMLRDTAARAAMAAAAQAASDRYADLPARTAARLLALADGRDPDTA